MTQKMMTAPKMKPTRQIRTTQKIKTKPKMKMTPRIKTAL